MPGVLLKMDLFKKYVISGVVGMAVGLLTLIGQMYLPMAFNFLANSGAVWLIPAFLISYYGKLDKKHSAAIPIFCLLGCVYGYYGFEALINCHEFNFGFYHLVWTACAFVGGGIFGLGAYFANHNGNWLRYFGQNLVPAVFLSEGVNKIIHISGYTHMVPAVVMVTAIGVLLYFGINGKSAFVKQNLLSVLAMAVLGLLGYEFLFKITS